MMDWAWIWWRWCGKLHDCKREVSFSSTSLRVWFKGNLFPIFESYKERESAKFKFQLCRPLLDLLVVASTLILCWRISNITLIAL